MPSATLIGIEKPCVVPLVLAAVSIPTTWFLVLKSGPPESPAWIGAFDTMTLGSFSALAPLSSAAVIVWFSAVTVPWPRSAYRLLRRRCRHR